MIQDSLAARSASKVERLREPLLLTDAASVRLHGDRSSFNLSTDGQWIAHTIKRDEILEKYNVSYASTGFPFAEGELRTQAELTNTRTGESIELGGDNGSSWAPVWSPDGHKVAFYADDDGEAGIWIWEKAARRAHRISGVIARPYFGFETVRWSADSQRLLCKILPEGMGVDQANNMMPVSQEHRSYPPHAANEPGVFVLGAHTKKGKVIPSDERIDLPETGVWTNRSFGDLAILDLRTHEITRIAERIKPLWYALSPDERYVAYSELAGFEPDSQQPNYSVSVYDLVAHVRRTVAENIRLNYGIEINWAPDSRHLAYIASGPLATGEAALISLADGSVRAFREPGVPSFDIQNGKMPPLWNAAGTDILAIGTDGKLWRVDITSGKGQAFSEIPHYEITAIVARPGSPTIWSTNKGRAAWVLAREREGQKAGLFSIDLADGRSRAMLTENKSYLGIFNIDASDSTGQIAYVAKDQQHLPDVWVFETRNHRARQISHINPALEHYKFGGAQLIKYRGIDGRELRAALLLPPNYKKGRRLPTVVWVYGGSMGSRSINAFGFWGDTPGFNMHVLATRGYAILFPDAPLNQGSPMKDLLHAVMPGVNAAIDQGYSDPDRLAVMGQSYGSYSALALIGQTTRFKAAIITAAALHPDLLAAYLEMGLDGSAISTGYYEHGQGNIGGTPWDNRDRYLSNSPIFLFDRIETPLLIGQGDRDGRLFASDATFVALRRLGKEVEYRIYENEGHVLSRRANIVDFWNRGLDFLRENLHLAIDSRGIVVLEETSGRS